MRRNHLGNRRGFGDFGVLVCPWEPRLKVVLPWYEALIYKGVDLRGVWTQEYDVHTALLTPLATRLLSPPH